MEIVVEIYSCFIKVVRNDKKCPSPQVIPVDFFKRNQF